MGQTGMGIVPIITDGVILQGKQETNKLLNKIFSVPWLE